MSVYSVNVYPSSATIKTGNWYYGAYAVVNASNNCNTDVTWYSNNTNVATVNASSGYIYARAPGTARIYAQSTIDSSKKDYITVTVTSGQICVDSVTLNKTSIKLEKGYTFNLCADICPTNATNKTIIWSSSKPSVATVSNNGVVTAKAKGWTLIYAKADDGSEEEAICYVEVTEKVLASCVTASWSKKEDKPENTLVVGQTARVYETVCPPETYNKTVTWTSSNPEVAFVNSESGFVTAISEGNTTIRATAKDGSEEYGECTLTVIPPIPVTGIGLYPQTKEMCVGRNCGLSATIYPSDATNKQVIWCSSNEDIATVGLYTGIITAKKAGTTTITATTDDGGFKASCEVRVYIDTVTIKKDGNYNKVIFNKSGKVWHCINCDMIYNQDNKINEILINRRLKNYYQNYDISNPTNVSVITYTDDEIKLLYAIDPCGVAAYIQMYAASELDEEQGLQYKDNMFKLLFNRNPEWFEYYEGKWVGTVYNSNLPINDVMSESESYFGVSSKLTGVRFLISAMDFVENVFSLFTGSTSNAIDIVCGLLRVGLYVIAGENRNAAETAGETVKDQIIDYIAKSIESVVEPGRDSDDNSNEWNVDILTDLIDTYNSYQELLNTVTTKPIYYPVLIDYCVSETNYKVYLELQNGEVCVLDDINRYLKQQEKF